MLEAILSLVLFVAAGGFILYLRQQAKRQGSLETQVETYEHVVENVRKANSLRDKLAADPDFRKRVRDRYTRR